MPKPQQLSLLSAILININIMIGAGLFINTVLISQSAGAAGPLVYMLIGILIFPLIATFSRLLKYHPGGNFYDFAKDISPYAGFLSLWSYFNTKMAAATLGIHVFVSLMQSIFPFLNSMNTLMLDCIIITCFLLLNMLHMKIGKTIQYSFIVLKMIPIFFAIITGFILFDWKNFSGPLEWSRITTSIPFGLYAFMGFEAISSLSKKIMNPEKNGPLAILISFFLVVSLIFLYQVMFYASVGPELAHLSSYLQAFPALIARLIPNKNLHDILQKILHTGIAASALGVAYGVIYSNSWNLHNLAKRNLAPGIFTSLNKYQVPAAAVLAEGFLAYSYILLTGGNQVPFQQITAIGVTTTYLLCSLGLVAREYTIEKKISFIGISGLLSCFILIATQLQNFYVFGTKYLLIFFLMMLAGSVMYFIRRNKINELSV